MHRRRDGGDGTALVDGPKDDDVHVEPIKPLVDCTPVILECRQSGTEKAGADPSRPSRWLLAGPVRYSTPVKHPPYSQRSRVGQ